MGEEKYCESNLCCLLKEHNNDPQPGLKMQTSQSRVLDTSSTIRLIIVENNYPLCNKTSLPSLCGVHVYVVMLHTVPGRLQQNPFLVSRASTCGIPFQTIGREPYLFLE